MTIASLSRRGFLASAAWTTAQITGLRAAVGAEEVADVLIIGASTGGVAAALAACRAGAKKVILTEPTVWIGGQLTSQLVPPDENKWIESYGASQSYLDFRKAIRTHYRNRTKVPLKAIHKASGAMNPGNGWVSRLCHEPIVGWKLLTELLQPFVEKKQLLILTEQKPTRVEMRGDQVDAVVIEDLVTGQMRTLRGKYVLDATEEGDLLPLGNIEHVTGTESRKTTGEPHAADKDRPGNIQSFTWCCILEHRDGEEHISPKPKNYDVWRPSFSWETPPYAFYPLGEKDPKNDKPNFWTYRRIIDKRVFDDCPGDISVVNWHLNDYAKGSLHQGTPAEQERHRTASREMTLALVHWLQTESPRNDGKTGWPGLRLCPEQTGTTDGLALAPYIRESRRLQADFTILEQHISRDIREAELGKAKARPVIYPDSVGIGHYLYIDIHKTVEGYSNGGGGKVFPFQIPMGALIPKRVTNLLAACKNLGVTHLTNGCYRLHPVEWNIGESAGALAAHCAMTGKTPKQVRESATLLADYQNVLTKQGVRLEWPAEALKG
ncbi:MAG: FAD-dependent oxidoreductase [Gemmataceae bacterium]